MTKCASFDFKAGQIKSPPHYQYLLACFLKKLLSYNKTNKFLKFILGMKLYMFRTIPLTIIRSLALYTQQWYMSYRFFYGYKVGR
jgi:hypothetical protein